MESGVIYQLRGTCASGKTTAIRRFVDDYPAESIDVGPEHPFALVKTPAKSSAISKWKARALDVPESEWQPKKSTHIGFRLPGDLVVLGRYGKAASGGLEGVPQDWIREVVQATGLSYRHVVFEGYHASVPTLVWVPMLERLYKARAVGGPFVIGFMNTPFDVCMERVRARTPGRTKPTNEPVQLEHYRQLHEKAYPFFAARPDIVTAEYVDYLNPYAQVHTRLVGGGWRG